MNEMQTRLGYILPLFRALGWNCSKQFVGQFPIRLIDFENPTEKSTYNEIVKLVETMLPLQKESQFVRREDDLDRVRNLERQIAQVDAEIDQRVYALYGLPEDEVKEVEGKE
jgi:hypothetical protein